MCTTSECHPGGTSGDDRGEFFAQRGWITFDCHGANRRRDLSRQEPAGGGDICYQTYRERYLVLPLRKIIQYLVRCMIGGVGFKI